MKTSYDRRRLALHGGSGRSGVLLFRTDPGNINVDIVIGLVAAASAVVTALFSMA